jgi:hypothetical protein
MPDDAEMTRVQELYEALTLLEEDGPLQAPRLSLADVVALLTTGRPLTREQQSQLFVNPRLRADFQRLKRDLAAAPLGDDEKEKGKEGPVVPIVRFRPAAAAASAGETEIDDREFDGFTIRTELARNSALIHIGLYDPASPPDRLQVEGPQGEISRINLPKPDGSRPLFLALNLLRQPEAMFVRRLRDPEFSVVLYRARGFAGGREIINTLDGATVSIAINFEDIEIEVKALLLESAEGSVERLELPPPNAGISELTMHLTDERRRLLLSPDTYGTYLG